MDLHCLRAESAAALLEPPMPIQAHIDWRSDEPMALALTLSVPEVLATLHGTESAITWHFCRDMLNDALMSPGTSHGLGDVRLKVIDDCLSVTVVGVAGVAHPVICDLEPIENLLLRSYLICPCDDEATDVDAAVAMLLGGTA